MRRFVLLVCCLVVAGAVVTAGVLFDRGRDRDPDRHPARESRAAAAEPPPPGAPRAAAPSPSAAASISRAGLSPRARQLTAGEPAFRVAYAPSRGEAGEQIRALFERERVFDEVAAALDRVVVMPRPLDIQMVDCGAANAFYDPDGQRIIICYELIGYFLDTFRARVTAADEVAGAAMGATFFAFFHELGHALIDQLELPSVGREEDAVDQLATLVLLEAGDDGLAMVLSGARWFGTLAEQDRRTPFWDEHSLDAQRFYNVLCLVFGAAPDARRGIVDQGLLPADRARRCAQEYAAIERAWDRLMAPHLRAAAAVAGAARGSR